VARQLYPSLDVLAAIPATAGANYSEVMLMDRDEVEPSRFVIGVRRNASEEDFRVEVKERLLQHLSVR